MVSINRNGNTTSGFKSWDRIKPQGLSPLSSRYRLNEVYSYDGFNFDVMKVNGPIGKEDSMTLQFRSNSGNEIIFDKKVLELRKPLDPYALFRAVSEELRKILDKLENAEYPSQYKLYFTSEEREVIEKLLQQTILNAVNAASKIRESQSFVGSEVSISASIKDDHLVFQISDNGSGFPSDILPKLGKESLSSRINDSELFMVDGDVDHFYSLVKIAEKHGWKVEFENRKEQNGATVKLAC